MATHSGVLAWRIPGTGEAGWAAVYGVAQNRTRLKRLSSRSSFLGRQFHVEWSGWREDHTLLIQGVITLFSILENEFTDSPATLLTSLICSPLSLRLFCEGGQVW